MNLFPQVIPHTPPKHCVRVHKILTPGEENMSKRGMDAASMRRLMTRERRIENQQLGRSRSEDVDQLVRVSWGKSFTASDLVEKAKLLNMQNIDKKAYSKRLQVLADKHLLKVVGKRGKETLYQAK